MTGYCRQMFLKNGSVLNCNLLILLVIFFSSIIYPSDTSSTSLPTLPIESGYGSHGPYKISEDSIPDSLWRRHSIYLFHPKNINEPSPVIFFCHGIGADNPMVYYQLIEHCVSRGYAVVYSPFSKSVAMRFPKVVYNAVWAGFEAGVKRWGSIIDTSKIGFMGHSYGGGMVPSFVYRAVKEKMWGKRGAFMYIMAPWYSYEITGEQLKTFPSHVNLVMEIFDSDRTNDHRMAIDIFNSISIPSSRKDFLTLESDTCGKDVMIAGHGVPEGVYRYGWDVNALDYYGVYRIADALADYTFNKNETAGSIALGNGNAEQRFMGYWRSGKPVKPLSVTDTPEVRYPQAMFVNFWDHAMNPRASIVHYFDHTSKGKVGSEITIENYGAHLVYPRKVRKKTEAYLESQGIKRLNDEDYRDDGNPDAEPPDSIDESVFQPIRNIENDFGGPGKYQVEESYTPHPMGGRFVLCSFSPVGYNGRAPVIMFAPPLNSSGAEYRQLLLHIAARGYKVIASSYRYGALTTDKKRYDALLEGFEEVFETEKRSIDTTRIGFLGHSYGAGALPAVSRYFFMVKHWGQNGAFLFLMSPSYMYNISDEQLADFPSWVNLTVEVFDKDHYNDHRIAEDIFYSINIPPSNKDFLYIRSASHGPYSFDADYKMPRGEDSTELNPLIYHAVYRQIDALAAYTFNNDTAAGRVALGNGCADQVYMGKWWDETPVRSLVSTDMPVFRNLRWIKPIMFLGMSSIVNAVWPVPFLCSFDDRRNERRGKLVP